LDRPPSQPPYRSGCFALIEELHVLDRAAQELPGQFARWIFRNSLQDL
jgi:hypothetical protein